MIGSDQSPVLYITLNYTLYTYTISTVFNTNTLSISLLYLLNNPHLCQVKVVFFKNTSVNVANWLVVTRILWSEKMSPQ